MRQFKINVIFLCLVFAVCLAAWSCGGGNLAGSGGSTTPAELISTVGTGSEDISALDVSSLGFPGSSFQADLADPENDIAKSLDSINVSAATLVQDPDLWWFLMMPGRVHLRSEAREVIEAPSHLAYYIWVNKSNAAKVPTCALVSNSLGCPMVPNSITGLCNVDINFGSSCDFTINGVTLNLSGELQHSSSVVQVSSGSTTYNGKWTIKDSAVNFKVKSNSKWLNYNGLVTK